MYACKLTNFKDKYSKKLMFSKSAEAQEEGKHDILTNFNDMFLSFRFGGYGSQANARDSGVHNNNNIIINNKNNNDDIRIVIINN